MRKSLYFNKYPNVCYFHDILVPSLVFLFPGILELDGLTLFQNQREPYNSSNSFLLTAEKLELRAGN